MTPETYATYILAGVALVGILASVVAWFFRRGGDERASTVALKDNTEAVKELAAEFRRFRDEVIGTLHDHDIRLTRLEVAPPPIHVTTRLEAPDASTSTHRDSGTGG